MAYDRELTLIMFMNCSPLRSLKCDVPPIPALIKFDETVTTAEIQDNEESEIYICKEYVKAALLFQGLVANRLDICF